MSIWYISLGIITVFIIWYAIEATRSHIRKREVEDANNERLKEERLQAKRRRKEEKELAKKEKFGKRSACLNYGELSISVYNGSKTVIINGKDFSFYEITGCIIREEATFIPGHTNTTYTIKPRTGSVFGRALLGSIVAGTFGSIIGATTANKDIIEQTYSTPDKVQYKYYVTIGISRKGWQDIVYATNLLERAEKIKEMIDKLS